MLPVPTQRHSNLLPLTTASDNKELLKRKFVYMAWRFRFSLTLKSDSRYCVLFMWYCSLLHRCCSMFSFTFFLVLLYPNIKKRRKVIIFVFFHLTIDLCDVVLIFGLLQSEVDKKEKLLNWKETQIIIVEWLMGLSRFFNALNKERRVFNWGKIKKNFYDQSFTVSSFKK